MSARAGPRVIAGFGRSGTTWVQDVLATANSLRAVFEPLHPIVIPDETIHPYCYRDGEVDDPALYRFLHKYFYEDFHSLWVDYRVIWPKLLPAQADLWSRHALKRVLNYNIQAKNNFLHFRDQRRHKQRIIKFVRANLILSWLQKVFGARIVFIIRHPAPVVASQMRASRSWDPQQNLARYRGDSQLLDVLNDGLKKLLFRSLDGVEAYALSWCVENAIALMQAEELGILVVCYENLVELGQSEWLRILSALDLQVMPDEKLVLQPSQQAWGEKARDSALVRQHASWMEHIDQKMLDRIQRVLDATGMDVYSVHQALPTKNL